MSGPRSLEICAAAFAMRSGESVWPTSAFSTEAARTGCGTRPPTATAAAVHVPPLTDSTAATPMTAYREAGCTNFA